MVYKKTVSSAAAREYINVHSSRASAPNIEKQLARWGLRADDFPRPKSRSRMAAEAAERRIARAEVAAEVRLPVPGGVPVVIDAAKRRREEEQEFIRSQQNVYRELEGKVSGSIKNVNCLLTSDDNESPLT